jgi:hypothetical protein
MDLTQLRAQMVSKEVPKPEPIKVEEIPVKEKLYIVQQKMIGMGIELKDMPNMNSEAVIDRVSQIRAKLANNKIYRIS